MRLLLSAWVSRASEVMKLVLIFILKTLKAAPVSGLAGWHPG